MTTVWDARPLGEVCRVVKSQGQHRDLPYVGMEDVESGTGRFLGSLEPRTVKSSTFRFEAGDVLYGRLRPYLNKVLVADFRGHCSTEIFPLRANPGVSNQYLMRWLSSDATVTAINATSTGARMPRANMNAVLGMTLPMPPFADQERIVRILDEALDGIATARANTEANLANGSALFDAALAQTFAAPGPAWAPRTLSSVSSDFGRGKSRHRPRNDPSLYGGAYPFVQTGDVRNADHVLTSYAVTYNEVGLRQSKLWPAGTLCITIAANIAESAVLGFDSCFPDSVVGLVPDPRAADSEFLEYLISHHRQVLKAKGKGSAQDNINLATFEDSAFPMPPVDEQARIAAELNQIRDLSSVVRVSRGRQERNLEDLRSSVLSAAFAGEL
ncbi:MAG: restriction endonuclease subunit S [Candidatus Nanopelagicales bacterium]